MNNRVALITGASSGIGLAVVELLSRQGYNVVGVSRKAPPFQSDLFTYLRADVREEQEVAAAIEEVKRQFGRLDVVVNCAGVGMVGPVEDTADWEARAVFDTNVFGVLNVCRYVLPIFRSQRGGTIINITSMAAQMALPYRGIYCASKFAVEGFTESLSQEVSAFGIRVVLLEPGDVATQINGHRLQTERVSEVYRKQFDFVHARVNQEVETGLAPEFVAKAVLSVLLADRPCLRYRVAPVLPKFAYVLMRILPDRWFEKLVMRRYGMK